jgi:hypothetical protein
MTWLCDTPGGAETAMEPDWRVFTQAQPQPRLLALGCTAAATPAGKADGHCRAFAAVAARAAAYVSKCTAMWGGWRGGKRACFLPLGGTWRRRVGWVGNAAQAPRAAELRPWLPGSQSCGTFTRPVESWVAPCSGGCTACVQAGFSVRVCGGLHPPLYHQSVSRFSCSMPQAVWRCDGWWRACVRANGGWVGTCLAWSLWGPMGWRAPGLRPLLQGSGRRPAAARARCGKCIRCPGDLLGEDFASCPPHGAAVRGACISGGALVLACTHPVQ